MITLLDVIVGVGVYLGLSLTVAILNRALSGWRARRGHVRWRSFWSA
jgi:hypothetical protein